MSQREAGLQEALVSSFDYMTSGIYTSMPGVVVSVDDIAESRITVQPSINVVSYDMLEITERPPVVDVPVLLPTGKMGGLTFPLQAGEPVMLVFSMRGLDNWKKSNGYPMTPSDRRKFDMRDCIAVPGAFPFGESRNSPSKRTLPHDPEDVVLVHNMGEGNEVEIRLKNGGGDVEINAPQSNVKVNCKNSEVNAEESVSYKTRDYKIKCVTYKLDVGDYEVNAGAYTLNVDQAGHNVSTGVYRMNGSFILNGIPHESHRHVETGSITEGPTS